MTYGRLIREAREARGWTQAELAERLNVSTAKISRWENSSRHKPGIDDINALVRLLPLSADILVGRMGLELSPPSASRLPRILLDQLLAMPPERLQSLIELLQPLPSDGGSK